MNKKTVLIVSALAALLVAIGLVLMVLVSTKQKAPLNTDQKLSTSALLIAQDFNWVVGESKAVTLILNDIDTYPALAFDIYFTFDPSEIIVENVEVGSLWTGANILLKEIDNNEGRVRFAAGQGFDDSKTGEAELLKVTLRPLTQTEETAFYMTGESAIAVSGIDKEIFLDPTELLLTVDYE